MIDDVELEEWVFDGIDDLTDEEKAILDNHYQKSQATIWINGQSFDATIIQFHSDHEA